MIKPVHLSSLLSLLVVSLCLAVAGPQTQQTADEQPAAAGVGREDPFAQFPEEKKPSASETTGIEEPIPELFLETITLKSLDAEGFRPLIAGMSSRYGSVSVDKSNNTLIIYDTKEALAKIMKLVPQKEILTENLVYKSYRIVYSDIDEIEKTLKTFISESGKLSANQSTGNILVRDFESNIRVIDNFIKEIDRLMQQVLVEVRIYDITYTESFDIEADWEAGRNNPITTISNTKTINELTNATTADTTTETTSTAWQHSDAGVAKHTSEATKTYTYRKSKTFVGGSFDADTGGTIRLGLLNDTVNVDIVLSMLRKQVEAKLLANPRILVLDNETAEFKIISEIPYTEESVTGSTITENVEFKDVGVELKVTPHITRDGMIRLNISPEFSVVVGTGSPPTVDKRIVNTKALVKDGQTVVLGGLRKRTVSQDIRKVPLLGDIPLLGALFTSVDEEVKTNELLIFITPRIVAEPTLSANELKGLKETEFGGPEVTYTEGEKAEKEKEKIEKKQPSKPLSRQRHPDSVEELEVEQKKQPSRQRYPSSVEELKRALAPSSKP